jgi:hypothetical protein
MTAGKWESCRDDSVILNDSGANLIRADQLALTPLLSIISLTEHLFVQNPQTPAISNSNPRNVSLVEQIAQLHPSRFTLHQLSAIMGPCYHDKSPR